MSQTPPPGQNPVDPRAYGGAQGPPAFNSGPPHPGFYPPPRRSGSGKTIAIVLLTVLLVGSVVVNFALLVAVAAAGASQTAGAYAEHVITPGDRKNKIAVVPLDGVINSTTRERFNAMIDQAANDMNVKAIVVEINSPGGEVTPSDEMYDHLLRAKQRRGIPVVISMSSLTASGGYYIACAGDEIFAQRTTLTGSIGVLFSRFDLTGLGEKYGVKDGTIVSDGATFKDAGSMFKPLTPEHETYFKSILNDAFVTFKDVVKSGRSTALQKMNKSVDEVANGKIYSADQALQLGLIDSIGYLDSATSAAAMRAKITGPHIVRIERVPTFFETLGGQAKGSQIGSVSAKDMSVSIESDVLQKLGSPKLLYLWNGQ
ncbi:MAG TPA: signal peptide peptidase SppA [Tepidisphaeraceae bacterium]|nr:signal peptide peptidase SppA [Tepidisphaeraceae bacterium]